MMQSIEESPVVDLVEFFERYGWNFEKRDACTFRTGFRGKNDAFSIMVRVTRHWVVFTINPLLDSERSFGPATLCALAQANHQSNLVKFGIDPDGDAFLTVEMPVEGFEYSHFQDALSAISHTADHLVVPFLQAQTVDRMQEQ
ncbi:MAG: hypothetical protein GY822_17900 [Deltaproteobacteria bacterium]|nr:hypothetical protein [Deltaproteobacteria bacterium]